VRKFQSRTVCGIALGLPGEGDCFSLGLWWQFVWASVVKHVFLATAKNSLWLCCNEVTLKASRSTRFSIQLSVISEVRSVSYHFTCHTCVTVWTTCAPKHVRSNRKKYTKNSRSEVSGHFGPRYEASIGHFGPRYEVSIGHFGPRSEILRHFGPKF